MQSGIVVCRGHDFLVEDNYVHHCGHGIWGSPTSGGVIRRNTFTDIMGTGLSLGGARATVVEENLVLRSYLNPYKVVAWAGPAIICNGGHGPGPPQQRAGRLPGVGRLGRLLGLGLLIYGNTLAICTATASTSRPASKAPCSSGTP